MLAALCVPLAAVLFVPIKPTRLARLELPVYGSEHLLLLGRAPEEGEHDEDDGGRVVPLLLEYADANMLEQTLKGRDPSGLALGGYLLGRKELFEAAAGASLGAGDMWRLMSSEKSFAGAVQSHLQRCALSAQCIIIGPLAAPKAKTWAQGASSGEVLERDLGAFTGAQPSSVRLSSLPTTLLCDRAGGEQQVALTLTSAAEAAALTWTQPLPWCMEASTWAERAIDPERAPESRAIAAL